VRYLTTGDVVAISEAEAGPDLLGDFGLLESAVLRPQQSVAGHDAYPDIHTKAAALLHSLIRNHPFLDGNKRIGVLSMLMFYGLNGFWIDARQEDVIALALDVAEGQVDVDAIAGRVKQWVVPIAPEEDDGEDR
jgi:death-on-curing protein